MRDGKCGRKVREERDVCCVCCVYCAFVCVYVCTFVYKNNVTMGGWAMVHTNLKQEDPLSMLTYHFNYPKITIKGTTVGKTESYLKTWSEERDETTASVASTGLGSSGDYLL